MISNQMMGRLWEDSRRLGVLTQLYRENFEDWRLLKCAQVFAKRVGRFRNAKLMRLLESISAWLRDYTTSVPGILFRIEFTLPGCQVSNKILALRRTER